MFIIHSKDSRGTLNDRGFTDFRKHLSPEPDISLSKNTAVTERNSTVFSEKAGAPIGLIPSENFNDSSLDVVIDYIVDKHHQHARENATSILDLAQQVVYKHGSENPKTRELAAEIFLFMHDFLNYMRQEEQILFANIRCLIQNNNRVQAGAYTSFGIIREWVEKMQKQHQETAERLRYFQQFTNGYSLPANACSAYKTLFEKMKEFEAKYLLHAYLENNILFPRALMEDEELEKMH